MFSKNTRVSRHRSAAVFLSGFALIGIGQRIQIRVGANMDYLKGRYQRRLGELLVVTMLGLILSAFFQSEALAETPVGVVKLAVGKVEATSLDQPLRGLKVGGKIFEGDVIKTHQKGFAVIVMDDNTKFTIKPNTELEISQAKSGADASLLANLVRGGMKVITGQIAKKAPEKFGINTPLGSIGVRGTSFDIWLCLGSADCALEYELFNDAIQEVERNQRLLFVHVTEGETVFLSCDGVPIVSPDHLGWSDGSADGCSVIPLPPSLTLDAFTSGSEALDESLVALEAPLLQQVEVEDVFDLCGGDPVCMQCKGDPICMQCNGDPSCYECQSDPLCSACNGDATCVACQGDALCQTCEGDPLCIQCDANSTCIACGNDPLCQCQGDPTCECGINPGLPICLVEEPEEESPELNEEEETPENPCYKAPSDSFGEGC